ncbi:MAG: glycosyltransferase family 2 protein [Kiritimatiellia bacterium]
MISIITSFHNQYGMNRLFLEFLEKYSTLPYQLIAVDNMSSDGSGDLFRAHGAVVIRNEANFNYPHCQNQGAALAENDYLFFLNNDLLVCPDWDTRALALMEENGLDFASAIGTNRMLTKRRTRLHVKGWYAVRYPFLKLSNSYLSLKAMHQVFFRGNYEGFCRRLRRKNAGEIAEGIAGFNVLMTRRGMERIGDWDERIQAGDYDVFLRAKERSVTHGDVRPFHVLGELYFHHYMRLTFKTDYPPFEGQEQIIMPSIKWGEARIREYMATADRLYFQSARSSAREPTNQYTQR